MPIFSGEKRENKMKTNKKTAKRILIIGACIILFSLISHGASALFKMNEVRDYVSSFGSYTPLILLVMIIVTSSIGFVFMVPVAVSAFILDIYSAFFISILGLLIGAIVSFFIARGIGRDYVERKYIHKIKSLEHFDEHLKKRGFITVLILRLILLVPYEIINIASGLSRVNVSSYFFGTLLGIIPGTILTIYFVSTTSHLMSKEFIFAAILLGIFSLLPLLSEKVRKVIFID